MNRLIQLFALLPGLLACLPLAAQRPQISLVPFASGLSFPVEMAHAGDSRLFIVEKAGRIMLLDAGGQLNPTPFLDIRSKVNSTAGERGMLGLAFPPDHDSSGWFYVSYNNSQGASVLSRFSLLSPDQANAASEEVLFTISQPFDNHNGGCLRFGPDGFLYFALGDGGSGGDPGNRSQTLSNPLGKILRIDVSQAPGFTVPASNPFAGSSTADRRIWSTGWRNPWKFSFDAQNGDMWIADVGQDEQEEINHEVAGTAGLNYGWRCREGLAPFNQSGCPGGYQEPIWAYQHGNNNGFSVTGGFVYRGAVASNFQGHYLFGDYATGRIWTLFTNDQSQLDSTQQGKLLPNGQLTSFGEDAERELYVLSKAGTVYRVQVEGATSLEEPLTAPLGVSYLADGQVMIRWNSPAPAASLRVFDMQGRLVTEEMLQGNSYRLPAGLVPGLYAVTVEADRVFVGKVLVK